jgi:hypothetical protein
MGPAAELFVSRHLPALAQIGQQGAFNYFYKQTMNQEWSIQARGVACSVTGIPFEAGQYFHTLLFDDKTLLRREDLSEESFKQRQADAPQPFSHWRSKFEPAPPKAPEALGKQTAEDLLRKYMADPNPGLANVRYILALMLERKRQLKEVEVRKNEDGSLTRIYHHGKSGEAFVIPDPGLKLSQVAEVQAEVADLLAAPVHAEETAEATQPSEPSDRETISEPTATSEPVATGEPLDDASVQGEHPGSETATAAPEPLMTEPEQDAVDASQAAAAGADAEQS